MEMAAIAEAKARDSPTQKPPQPEVAPAVLTSVQEAVRRVRMGGDGADFLVVEWRQGPSTLGSKPQEQLEIKEVRPCVQERGGWRMTRKRSPCTSRVCVCVFFFHGCVSRQAPSREHCASLWTGDPSS